MDANDISAGFKAAYKTTSLEFPCFGGQLMSSKEWWRHVVIRTFANAGEPLPTHKQDSVFSRVYSIFGSHRAYESFDDARVFLEWAARNGLKTGVTSNGDDRFKDGVLPMLDLEQDLDWICLSKEVGHEKPHPAIFEETMRRAGLSDPSELLHVGDNRDVDYDAPINFGAHALLLDRFGTQKAARWRHDGVIVLSDLLDVVEELSRAEGALQGT